MRPSDGPRCVTSSMAGASRSATISPSVRSAALPSDSETRCSPVRRRAASSPCAIYTVIQTCKDNGAHPQVYIADVTGTIAANWPAALWDEFKPWNWAPQTEEPVVQVA